MLFTSWLTMLVFSTFKEGTNNKMRTTMMNRLGVMMLSYMMMLMMNSMKMMMLKPGMTMYNSWLSLTMYKLPMMLMMMMMMMGMLMYKCMNERKREESSNYTMLMLGNSMGLMLLPLANDLLTLYMMMELQSYSLYLLTGMDNKSYNASRASMLYFLMGGVASAMMLLSMYFMYNLTGTTNLSDIYMFNNYKNTYPYFDMLLMALFFKMGLAPLHRWSMAVYNYTPTYMTAYMSMVAKLSMISWMFYYSYLFNNYIFMMFYYMSLFMGSYKPLLQMNMKTMLGYSGMLNFGYLLLTMMTLDSSFYMFMMQYTMTHLLMFMIMLSSSNYMMNPMSKWSPLMYMNQLNLPNYTLSMCMVMGMLSLMGMPPLPGFYAKFNMLMSALEDNYILESLMLMICSVLATYYYANLMKMLMRSKTMSHTYNMNLSLAYLMATLTVMLMSFNMYLPYMSEGMYLMMI
uniref:NADH-ubiquinone oxidoreductase chain 2 n=1 Tax=Metschnikowia arizonensis TaxID=150206 RepID=A0A7D7H2N9_9ASCO|nr:Nad2 [Metschnikowia arizonensis]QMJ95757.1 Nad2 [Metschnikowia arizonensis]